MTGLLTKEEFDEKWDAEFEAGILPLIASGKLPSIQEIKKYAEARKEAAWSQDEAAHRQAVQTPVVATKRRGRPQKERAPVYKYKAAIGSSTLADTDKWKEAINKAVACGFPEITEVQRMTLVPRLVHAAGHYAYGTQLRAIQKNKTNKLHTEKPVLIYECAKAWEHVTGETLTVWYAADSTILQEPKGVKLARIAAKAVGRPLVGDLRRHAAKAKEMLDKDKRVTTTAS